MRDRFRPASFLAVVSVAALVVLLATGLSPRSAQAQITAIQEVQPLDLGFEDEQPFILYGLTVFGSVGSYDMLELNEALKIVNAEIAEQGSFGVQYDSVDRGGAYGAGLRAVVAERYVVTADFERTIASTSVGGVTSESRLDISADIFSGSLGYDFLASPSSALGFAAGLGWYSSRAEQVITETLTGQDEEQLGRIKLDGTTVSPHFQVFFEAQFTARLFVGLTAGYRSAKVKDLDITGLADVRPPLSDTAFVSVPVAETDAEDATHLRGGGDALDWSGLFGRASMTFYFNAPTL